MTRAIIMNSFISGEIDRAFYARSDLQKYGSGLALAKNFIIDFRGGIKARPGFVFLESLTEEMRLFSFSRGETEHPYIIMLGVETLKIWDGTDFLVDVFATPFTADDLPNVQADFRLNRMVFTCTGQAPQELVFEDGSFSFSTLAIVDLPTFPAGLTFESYKITGTGSSRDSAVETGNAQVVFAVSAVFADGSESLAININIASNKFNYTVEAGFGLITWDAVTGAVKYKVYRSIILEQELDKSAALGFLGETVTTSFTDNNYIVDFSQPPKQVFDPFANESVLEIEVTDPGSGFLVFNVAFSVSSVAGSGLLIRPVVSDGEVIKVLLFYGGSGYKVGDTITITNDDGPDAEAEITAVSPVSGNNPAASLVAQQRRYFAGTENLPLTFNASRIGKLTDFSSGSPPAADDAFSYSVDAEDISPIKHLLRARKSIILMHANGVDRLLSSDNAAIGPTNREIENQARIGVGDAPPVAINDDIVFNTHYGSSVISMAYTFYTNSYAPQDVSVLAPHLFENDKVQRFGWNPEPDKILWVLMESGKLLSLTYMKEQETFAWAQHTTGGSIKDILVVNAPDEQILYAVIQRTQGVQLERMASLSQPFGKDYVGVDSAVVKTPVFGTTTVEGLEMFEGRQVTAFGTNQAALALTVTDGSIEVPFASTSYTIGLPIDCQAVTLPLTNPQLIQDGVKGRITGLALRLEQAPSLEIGADPRALYEVKDGDFDNVVGDVSVGIDYTYVYLADNWKRDSQIYIRQRYPFPAQVLGFVADIEVEK